MIDDKHKGTCPSGQSGDGVTGDDSALIAAAIELEACEASEIKRGDDVLTDDEEAAMDAERRRLEDMIADTPATTMTGIIVKLSEVVTSCGYALPKLTGDAVTARWWNSAAEAIERLPNDRDRRAWRTFTNRLVGVFDVLDQTDAELVQARTELGRLRREADDAELLTAFRAFVDQDGAVNNPPPGSPDPTEAESKAYDASVEGVAAAPATTLAGIVVKLATVARISADSLVDVTDQSRPAVRMLAQVRGAVSSLPDPVERRAVEWMVAGLSAEYRSHHEAAGMWASAARRLRRARSDAFTETVGAFEKASSGPLSVPQAPTAAMTERAASAAGITPEQFATAYAAALEAFREECAA